MKIMHQRNRKKKSNNSADNAQRKRRTIWCRRECAFNQKLLRSSVVFAYLLLYDFLEFMTNISWLLEMARLSDGLRCNHIFVLQPDNFALFAFFARLCRFIVWLYNAILKRWRRTNKTRSELIIINLDIHPNELCALNHLSIASFIDLSSLLPQSLC